MTFTNQRNRRFATYAKPPNRWAPPQVVHRFRLERSTVAWLRLTNDEHPEILALRDPSDSA